MLKPAAQLKAETEARKNESARKAHETQMADVERAINDAHAKGQTRAAILPPLDSVRSVLEAAGYRVSKRNGVAGAGDCETVEIRWDI